MLTESDVLKALADLSNPGTLNQAITGLQLSHSPKHHQVTHVVPPDSGYGSSFFMKKNPLMQNVTTQVWGKPVAQRVAVPGQFSEVFGDYTDIDRADEARIVGHLRTSDSVSYALDTLSGKPNRFLLFSDVPQPYVGFDWVHNKCLPVEAGYLAMVIEKAASNWKIITVFPCARAYYQRYQTKVLHKR